MRRLIEMCLANRAGKGLAPMLVAAAGMAFAAPATAQYDDEGWEWEPDTGYHEEEWYDPGDWFDDDYYGGVDYEELGWGDDDYGYDYYDTGAYDDYYYEDRTFGYEDYWYDDDYTYDAGDDYDWYDVYDDDDYYDDDYTADWDYYTDENDPADYDYWDSRRDFDRTARDRRDRMGDSAYVYRDNRRDTRAMNDRRQRGQGMRTAQLRGELEAWQRKNLQGQRDAHTLVRMTTEDGRSAVVNLGPNVDLGRLDLDEDDRIAVRGYRGSIDGRPVLMAQRVRVGDRTIRMNNWEPRQNQMNQQRQQGQQGMRSAQLRGELEAWQRKSLQGQRDAHTLVRLRVQDGRAAIVNLGPNVELSRLNLDEGDRIAVRGQRGTIDGRPVLMAQRVRVGDRTIRMNNWDPRGNRGGGN